MSAILLSVHPQTSGGADLGVTRRVILPETCIISETFRYFGLIVATAGSGGSLLQRKEELQDMPG